ncbi:hypothetical protein ADINL_1909 [Nitrincola lacisaponensis]|uniref:Uncharacterized protein n=1 Tax=Nitrincola lacisaponensis TaxID=267850 RepID=A0A063Y4D1_9GAMM|nr:hypothetical protein [Nitrincola lacisaponensis]KDE39631.1 hypothetical protein ADINL_1909 [Nitrincola lacisaponensis]
MSLKTFEGAGAVFTFFDQPLVLGLITLGVVAAVVLVVVASAIHEKHSFSSPMDPRKNR